jgi:hypothetical protein
MWSVMEKSNKRFYKLECDWNKLKNNSSFLLKNLIVCLKKMSVYMSMCL